MSLKIKKLKIKFKIGLLQKIKETFWTSEIPQI